MRALKRSLVPKSLVRLVGVSALSLHLAAADDACTIRVVIAEGEGEADVLLDAADKDADGLDDEAEEYIGTDPNKPDSDGDGRTDGEEVYCLPVGGVDGEATEVKEEQKEEQQDEQQGAPSFEGDAPGNGEEISKEDGTASDEVIKDGVANGEVVKDEQSSEDNSEDNAPIFEGDEPGTSDDNLPGQEADDYCTDPLSPDEKVCPAVAIICDDDQQPVDLDNDGCALECASEAQD
jgi:hypothetical protein